MSSWAGKHSSGGGRGGGGGRERAPSGWLIFERGRREEESWWENNGRRGEGGRGRGKTGIAAKEDIGEIMPHGKFHEQKSSQSGLKDSIRFSNSAGIFENMYRILAITKCQIVVSVRY